MQPRRNVKIHGCGIFEAYPIGGQHPFKYGYKYVIQEAGTQNEIFTSEVYIEDVPHPDPSEVDDHIIKYQFKSHPEGISVKSN